MVRQAGRTADLPSEAPYHELEAVARLQKTSKRAIILRGLHTHTTLTHKEHELSMAAGRAAEPKWPFVRHAHRVTSSECMICVTDMK